jgi:hypothetical protein
MPNEIVNQVPDALDLLDAVVAEKRKRKRGEVQVTVNASGIELRQRSACASEIKQARRALARVASALKSQGRRDLRQLRCSTRPVVRPRSRRSRPREIATRRATPARAGPADLGEGEPPGRPGRRAGALLRSESRVAS